MPIARINARLLHFVHVPKTGGSSVKEYLMKKGPMAFFNRAPLPWARTTPQHIESATHRILIPEGFCDAAFMVVRDPVARLLSEFRYRTEAAVGDGRYRVDLGNGLRFTGTFDGWAHTVLDMVAEDAWACDNHMRPQSDFWREDVQVFVFEAGLGLVFEWIDQVTGTPPGARFHENKGNRVQIDMSEEVRARVEAFYAADLEFIEQARAGAFDLPLPPAMAQTSRRLSVKDTPARDPQIS